MASPIRDLPGKATRNTNDDITELLPFKRGKLKIAEKSGCPVIPVAMTGTAEVLEKHFPFITPSHITVYYGKPINIKELDPEDRKHPGAYTRNVLIGMLKEMQERKVIKDHTGALSLHKFRKKKSGSRLRKKGSACVK